MFNQLFRLFYPTLSPSELMEKYNIPRNFNIHVDLTPNGYFVLTCNELPGLITEAKDGKELIKMFNDAVLTYYDVPKREGDIVHERMNLDGYGTFVLKSDNRVKQEA